METQIQIIIDSREQQSYLPIFEHLEIPTVVQALNVGDYSIVGFEKEFALERKTLNDFVSSITYGRERFLREIERSKSLKYFAIIIEASYQDIRDHNYYSKTSPKSVLNTILSWMIKYNLPILLAGTREGGSLAVVRLSEFYLKHETNR